MMQKNIFIELVLKTRNIRNVLIIGDQNFEISQYIIKEILDNNGNVFISGSDFNGKVNSQLKIINNLSSQIMSTIMSTKMKIDIVYVMKELDDLECIFSNILDEKGIIVYDGVIPPMEVSNLFDSVYSIENFFVYQNKNSEISNFISEDIKKRIEYTCLKKTKKRNPSKTIVGIGVITYNHEKYILECLDSIFKQKGDFKLKIVIVDDCSSDKTTDIIDSYLKNVSLKADIEFIKNKENKGVIDSIKTLLEKFRETDYFTFCEGDDFWNSSSRIQKFISYMKANPNVSVAFNSFYVLDHEKKTLIKNLEHLKLEKEFFVTQELIEKNYFIGNLGCCFYDSFFLKYMDKAIFDLPLYDFFINTYYSTFGLIGHLNEFLSTYRIHSGSFWSTQKQWQRNNKLSEFINIYNNYFNYIYDYEYTNYQNLFFLYEKYRNLNKLDLLIIDNIFPNVLSPFSYEEISSYLYHIDKSMVLCTYLSGGSLSNETLRNGLIAFKKKNPLIASKVTSFTIDKALKTKTKLLYFIFKSTTMYYYSLLKEKKSDFIFELYPGGGFFFDDPQCDADLKKIMKLKGFKKVIVTQEPVRQYLLKKKLCKEKQIELIFGVVMNNEKNKKYKKELFYGINKKQCDIVFMAHKYHEFGIDKGYDLFIDTAKKMCEKHDNVHFHVVGNFDENVLDVTSIKDYITFYGPLNKSEFDTFFHDKDMIISANRPNILYNGAFDGFPTASSTEAGIREVAMLCSDVFNMHQGYYNSNQDLVIIQNNVDDILEKVEYLYNHPKELQKIAKNGRKRIIELYSYDSQIKPRLELLNKIINKKGV